MAGLFMDDAGNFGSVEGDENAEVIVEGGGDTIPTVGQEGQKPADTSISGYSVRDVLGVITGAAKAAKDVGTAVGTIQREAKQIPINYSTARNAAASGNVLQTWWIQSSQTDKLMVAIGIVGLVIAFKGK